MEKETRRKGINRRQKQDKVTDEKRKSIERRSVKIRRSGFDCRKTEFSVMLERRNFRPGSVRISV